MANVKITELTAATALAGTDVLPIVDVGADATKKVSVSDLLRNLPDGTASAPALAFADDQNTGVLSPGNNSLAFATSGTERVRIDSSGRLTTGDPSNAYTAKLTSTKSFSVVDLGNGATIQLRGQSPKLFFDSTDSGKGEIYLDNTHLAFFAGTPASSGSERMRLTSGGNLGLGLTSPGSLLHTSGSRDYTGSTPNSASYDVNFLSGTAGLGIGQSNGIPSIQGYGSGTAFNLALCPNAGKVGIGTTSPSRSLHVSGTVTNILQLENTNADVAGIELKGTGGTSSFFHNAGAFRFLPNGTERMRITSSGNIGIGTTSPDDILDVRSGSAGFSQFVHLAGQGGVRIAGTGASSSANLVFSNNHNSGVTDEYTIQMSGDNDRLTFRSGGTGATERVSFMADGKVGIGTTSVDEHLHVEGSGSNERIKIENTTSNIAGLVMLNTSRRYDVQVNGSDLQIYDNTGSAERLRINSSGRLGVGTTSPTSDAGTTMYRNTSGNFVLNILNDHASGYGISVGSDSNNIAYFYSSAARTAVVGTISKSASSTSYNTSSDYRLKENVVDLADGITRVKQLQPRRFNFIADAGTTVDGFVAHEAQTVVPEAVTGTHNEVDDDGNAVMQGIDQSKLVPLLTAALQEAIAKIETLETKVAALEAQ